MAIFSNTIRVPVEVLLDNAAKLEEFADEQGGIFDRVNNLLQSLHDSGQWSGASWNAAAAKIEEYKEEFSTVVAETNELAKFLQTFAGNMADKDEELKNRILSA